MITSIQRAGLPKEKAPEMPLVDTETNHKGLAGFEPGSIESCPKCKGTITLDIGDRWFENKNVPWYYWMCQNKECNHVFRTNLSDRISADAAHAANNLTSNNSHLKKTNAMTTMTTKRPYRKSNRWHAVHGAGRKENITQVLKQTDEPPKLNSHGNRRGMHGNQFKAVITKGHRLSAPTVNDRPPRKGWKKRKDEISVSEVLYHVPIPGLRGNVSVVNLLHKRFKQMRPGAMIKIKNRGVNTITAQAYLWAKKNNLDWKFTGRTKGKGVWLWRTK